MSVYSIYVEGQQLDELKKKRAEEKAAQEAKEKERNDRRYDPEREYNIGSKAHIKPSDLEHPMKLSDIEKFGKDVENDQKRNTLAHTIVARDNKQRYGSHHDATRFTPNYMQRKDAVNKDMRRHPEKYPELNDSYKEQGIFAECVLI